MNKNYQELVKNRIFFGGVADVESAIANENVDVVIDLRVAEPEEVNYLRIHAPIADEEAEIIPSIQHAVYEVMNAYRDGKKVFFHCGSGSGRAGTIATATLLELGQAKTVEEAEQKAKEIRSKVNVREPMKNALQQIYE
ncbi:protein-tyrosine phosphatase family protein [Rummeliibacillus pycnus]|uniref:protein-tyrosine phosphatase family protein n=1 Tax=Rummeliibacillus pycnus TaxID=101070 RepID=UPI000C9B7067|nr:dual specificity protein phosphatase family protein [Rummeliibacillus pycnus]